MNTLTSVFAALILACMSISTANATAVEHSNALKDSSRYLAEIRVHTPGEIEAVLQRASMLVDQASDYTAFEPIAVVLHGDEADVFRYGNYQRYQRLIDLAAKLDAFKVIDVRICETWMRLNNVKRSEMPAFVETVPYGPAEERQLKRKGYKYF